jgi:hypothetical protein
MYVSNFSFLFSLDQGLACCMLKSEVGRDHPPWDQLGPLQGIYPLLRHPTTPPGEQLFLEGP